MGNNNKIEQNKKNRLVDYKIPQNYYQTCHPNILDYNIDQKQLYLFSASILNNSYNQKWKLKIQPLLPTKYIFTPTRITNNNLQNSKTCCTSQPNSFIDQVNIAYQPFIYSLNIQISSRKQKLKYFTQQQLWKIIKYLTKALIQWHNIYQFEKIASIMPQNIILNYKGNLRLVTQYSFPKDSYFHKPKSMYQPPEDKTSSVIKYANQPNKYKVLSSDLYGIGMTVLDCLLLERSQQPVFQTVGAKLNYMWEHYEDKYSRQLRSIIDTLLNEDYKKRPNPHDLVQLAQINQTKFP